MEFITKLILECNIECNIDFEMYLFVSSPKYFRKLCWQFNLIMQVTANVFITAIHSLYCDTTVVAVTEGPIT